jgi:cation diffusion facilitator family transporter
MNPSTTERAAAGRRVTWVSIAVNVVLSAAQIAIGLQAHAQSLVADGFHSLADLFDDFIVLAANRLSHDPADANHPYGHQRIETLASLALGLTLVGTGLGILYTAIQRLQHLDALPPLHSIAFWVALVTLIAKEALFRYMLHVGEKHRSPLLIANAWHARSDAASSLVVALGIAGGLFGWRLLDPVAALVVGLMIVRTGWRFSWDALSELIDTGISELERSAVRATILATPGVVACPTLRSRRMAHAVLIDATVQVAPRISVSEGHQIAETVQDHVLAAHDAVIEVLVHVAVETDDLRTITHQPSRTEVISALRAAGVIDLDEETPMLHYLNSGLEIELTHAPDPGLPNPDALLDTLRERFPAAEPPIAKLDIRFTSDLSAVMHHDA